MTAPAPARTRIRHIVLVNWRGTRFQAYELARHITALEGANGVGKTQVMAAAYVALLPMMRHIQFKEVGESSASGRGLHGRLGNGRFPSFSAIDCDVPGVGRVIAGVQLDPGAGDHVDLRPFLITDLAPSVKLADVFLNRTATHESFLDRPGLRSKAKELGGDFESPDSANAYCRRLFELGIIPLPINDGSAIAQRWADLLRTSMYGGLSAAVTTGIKDFLLRREDELSRTLETIRENLRSCRLTQDQVRVSQAMRQDLAFLCDAGALLLVAALAGARAAAQEAQREIGKVMRAAEALLTQRDQLNQDLNVAQERLQSAKDDEERAQKERRVAEQQVERVTKANQLEQQISTLQLQVAEAIRALTAAQTALDQAKAEEAQAVEAEAQRRKEWQTAQEGLTELQKGLEELATRSARHLRARELLESLAAEESDHRLAIEQLPELQRTLTTAKATTATSYAEAQAEVAGAVAQRERFLSACEDLAAVREITLARIEAHTAFADATEALQQVERARVAAADAEGLGEVRAQLVRQLERQRDAQQRAAALGLDIPYSASRVDQAAKTTSEELERTQARHRTLTSEGERLRATIESLQAQEHQASAEFLIWNTVQDLALRVGASAGHAITTPEAAQHAAQQLQQATDAARAAVRVIEAEIDTLSQEQDRLSSSGTVAPVLRALCDAVEGTFLSQVHDAIPLADAADTEARLGPWRDAIVVDHVQTAAEIAANVPKIPDTIYLLPQDAVLDAPSGTPIGSGHVLVADGDGFRLTRRPHAPVLGSRAREARQKEIRHLLIQQREALERAQGTVAQAASQHGLALDLLRQSALLSQPDPRIRANGLRAQATAAQERANAIAGEVAGLGLTLTQLSRRNRDLRELLPMAELLDLGDLAAQLQAIDGRIAAGKQASTWLKRVHAPAQRLATSIQTLRQVPLADEQVEELRHAAAQAHHRLVRLEDRLRRLQELLKDVIALDWTDAPRRYQEREHLLTQLQAQVAESKKACTMAESHLRNRRDHVETTRQQHQGRQKEHDALDVKLQHFRQERANLPVDDASDGAVEAAEEAEFKAIERSDKARQERDAAFRHQGDAERALKDTTEKAAAASTEAEQTKTRVQPMVQAWDELQTDATALRFLPLLADAKHAETVASSAEALGGQQRSLAGQLAKAVSRMAAAKPSAETDADAAKPVIDSLVAIAPSTQAREVLAAWLRVHRWMQHRLPTQLAASDNLFVALAELDVSLQELQQRHVQYEERLKSTAADVAQKIRLACRRATQRIAKLNTQLAGISFGSVSGIEVKCEMSPDGARRLDLLSNDQGQMRWDPAHSFSEAIQHLLGEQGGQPDRYLDYRTYLTVQLAIERRDGSNATGVSTGESIGVGASLLMATMSLWEEEYRHLARASRRLPLRFLFLDEANRLDQKNQNTIMELCRTMDLQLLVAAPEVSSTVDNITYRLATVDRSDGMAQVSVARHARRLNVEMS